MELSGVSIVEMPPRLVIEIVSALVDVTFSSVKHADSSIVIAVIASRRMELRLIVISIGFPSAWETRDDENAVPVLSGQRLANAAETA